MRIKSFSVLLAILLVTSLMVSLTIVAGKPFEPNPEGVWPSGTVWGTKLHMENIYIRESWFGAGPTAQKTDYFEVMPDYVTVVFIEDSTMYDKIVKLQDTPPQSYSWYVKLFSGGSAPSAGTLSWVLENATHEFIPHDFSIVLDNQAQGILVNLRAQDNHWFSLPTYATLYVDNAVNVSISPSSQSGGVGENLIYTVTVNNTGRYDDTYTFYIDAGNWSYIVSPSSLSINAGDNAYATLTVTLGAGPRAIIVIADGAYADDNASCTVTATGVEYYNLTANIDPPGSGSVTLDPAGGTYEEGTYVTATANPTSGYEFDHWSGDASGTSTSVTVTMNSEKSITAHFRSVGEGKAREGLPWTWIGAGMVIVIAIIVAVVATRRGR